MFDEHQIIRVRSQQIREKEKQSRSQSIVSDEDSQLDFSKGGAHTMK
ncbi:MAG: hypothetical protein ACMG6E_04890 [Candidatus Roizmanbacteria bacterium]